MVLHPTFSGTYHVTHPAIPRTILHDPRTYPEPSRFNPDRFLSPDSRAQHEHVSVAFGYGRRICPGRFMAEAQLWISIACILSVLDIGPGVDEIGIPIKTEAAFASGMIWSVDISQTYLLFFFFLLLESLSAPGGIVYEGVCQC